MKPLLFTTSAALAIVLTTVTAAAQADSSRAPRDLARRERMKASSNYESGRFVNDVPTSMLEVSELWTPLKDQVVPARDSRPSRPMPVAAFDSSAFDAQSGIRVVWLGHSTLLARIDGVTIMFDPVFDDTVRHAAGSALRFQPPPLTRGSLPPIDGVVISHDHFDHLERTTVDFLASRGVVFVVPLGLGTTLEDWSVPESQIVELDWWESARLRGLELVCTPARHYSGRDFSSMNKTLWSTWVVLGPTRRLFFGGDTGYLERLREVGTRYGPFDIAAVPIGAYDDAWADIHLRPEEAAIVHGMVRGELMIPLHWGTFDLSTHAWDEPIERLVRAAEEARVSLCVPRMGEVVDPAAAGPFAPWWRNPR